MVDKILRCMGNEVIIGDSDLQWSHDPALLVPKDGADLPGYTKVPVTDRQQLHDVSTANVIGVVLILSFPRS